METTKLTEGQEALLLAQGVSVEILEIAKIVRTLNTTIKEIGKVLKDLNERAKRVDERVNTIHHKVEWLEARSLRTGGPLE